MSLRHSPEEHIDRTVLIAVAAAIRRLESVSGSIEEYDISKDDAFFLCSALSDLWTILYANGYTIDADTNRLKKQEE
jgi:hypothetical protein